MPRSPLTVLHLSDVQFGKDHRFAGLRLAAPDAPYQTLLARLVEDLDGLNDEEGKPLQPDLIFVTGDLAEWGRKSELDDALAMIQGLSGHLHLPPDRVVLIPGNHDINRPLCEGYFATSRGNEEEPQEPYWAKWGPFVAMFRQFYGDTPGVSFTPNQPWSLFEIPELEVVVAALNSTLKESHRDEDHHGWVGEAQLHWFAEQLKPYRNRGWWRLAAVHHNVRRGPVQDDENLRDGDRFRALLGPLVHAVFHGHTHDGKLDWLNNKVPILATGSAAVLPGARPPEVPNQYQIVRLWPDRIERWARRYVPGQVRWVGDDSASPDGNSWRCEETVAFDLPRAAGREIPPLEPHREHRAGPERILYDDLLSRVQQVCYLREKSPAQVERLAAGHPPFEYLRVSARDDFSQRVYAVGAITGDVTADHLNLFLDRVHQRYREADPGTRSILVATGLTPPHLLDEARRNHVDLISFVEFQGLLDLRTYVTAQTAELAADPVYPPELFVPQRLQYEEGRGDEETSDALEKVWSWLRDPRGRFILILGDFGTGKTFLLHELARRMGAVDPGLTPVLLQMRALEKSHTLDELLSQHFGRRSMDFSPRKFRYMLEQGRIVLLVDGFDELAVRVTYPQAVHHFDTLLQAAAGAAKVVVTSRRQHFLTDQEIRTKVETLTGRRIARLQPFDRGQVKRFLETFCGDAAAAARRLDLLDSVEDLMGLSQNPRLLRFIVDLPEATLEEAATRAGKISAAALYQLLLDRWLLIEEERVTLRGAQPNLTRSDRWRAVTALAMRLWEKTDPSISLTEIEAAAAQIVRALKDSSLDPQTAAFQVGSGTLFVRDEEGRFSFLHQSVLEWIVAREAARELTSGAASDALSRREMSRLMVEFFCDLAGRETALAWARGAELQAMSEAAQANGRLVLHWLGEDFTAQRMAGKDLRGSDYSHRFLNRANLARADLSDSSLRGAFLRRANLRGATLLRADLAGADLRGADLFEANLSSARLTRADVRAASFAGAVLHRASLLGCYWGERDSAPLAEADTWASAVDLPQALEARAANPWDTPSSLAFSHDGNLLAAAERQVVLWDLGTGRELRRFEGHRGSVLSVVFAPNGRYLASGGLDSTPRLFDVATGREIRRFAGHKAPVRCIAFSWDGEQLASADEDGLVYFWIVATGQQIRQLRPFAGPEGKVLSLAFAPDGTRFASGARNGTLKLWDIATRTWIASLEGHRAGILSVAFSADGSQLASASYDGSMRLWETETAREIRCIPLAQALGTAAAFGPDGTWLAGSAVGLEAGMGHGVTAAMAAAPGGTLFADARFDGRVQLWEAITDREVQRFVSGRGETRAVVFAADGKRLVSIDADHLYVWEAATGREILRAGGNFSSVAFAPDGKYYAAADVDQRAVRLWKAVDGREIQLFAGHDDWVRSVAFAPDGLRIATGSDDRTVRIWDVATRFETHRLIGHSKYVYCVAFAPGHDELVSTGADGTVRFWNTHSGRERGRCEGDGRALWSLAFDSSGRYLAASGEDGTAWLLDTATGRELRRFEGHSGCVRCVAFSLHQIVASAGDDHAVRLWDAASGFELRRIEGHSGPVFWVAFAPSGAHLASASLDGTVRLWDVASGSCLAVLVSLPEGWAAHTPDGRYKVGGIPAGGFWHVINLCRFEAGELDELVPGLHLPDDASFYSLPPWAAKLQEIAEG